MNSASFVDLLEENGYDFFTGVPCSYFAGVLQVLDRESRFAYIGAVREDSAIGVAAGAYLGGRQPVVFTQNSGLGVSINALASLNIIYRIPVLLIVSWRGQHAIDAPQHRIMGSITEGQLDLLKISSVVLDSTSVAQQLRDLTQTMLDTAQPVAILIPKGSFDS